MEMFKFYLENILRPVFEDTQLIGEDPADRMGEDEHEDVVGSQRELIAKSGDRQRSNSTSTERGNRQAVKKTSDVVRRRGPEDILDLSGPKLIEGCRSWIYFYQLVGQLNWLGVPLYLSIIYKSSIIAFIAYFFFADFLKQLFITSIDLTYRNPIFIFISLLAATLTFFHSILSFYNNLLYLCPLFKVLTTPKLCFISEDIQHIIGTKTITISLIFLLYHTTLLALLCHSDSASFFNDFRISRFILMLFANACTMYYLIGLAHLDFYIRGCFAAWLVALKGNLEYRFAHLHRHQRLYRLRQNQRLARHRESSRVMQEVSNYRPNTVVDGESVLPDRSGEQIKSEAESQIDSQDSEGQRGHQLTLEEFKEKYKIVTLDEIQKNLNTMDDHLEVLRSVQTSSLVLITLNAFLTNGALLLLAYNLLANKGNYYHGLLLILIAVNYTIIIFFCYIGDSWLYYALSSFVQTVEDEYFLQGGDGGDISGAINSEQSQSLSRAPNGNRSSLPLYNYGESIDLSREHQLLLIKKKDVLFCREFLHQFENHLATPWSKLTVKVHLRIIGTFVTLIAAQIIFDHEH